MELPSVKYLLLSVSIPVKVPCIQGLPQPANMHATYLKVWLQYQSLELILPHFPICIWNHRAIYAYIHSIAYTQFRWTDYFNIFVTGYEATAIHLPMVGCIPARWWMILWSTIRTSFSLHDRLFPIILKSFLKWSQKKHARSVTCDLWSATIAVLTAWIQSWKSILSLTHVCIVRKMCT